MPNALDLRTAVLFAGGLYVVLPLLAWTILAHRHDRTATAWWCGGGLLHGVAFTLAGLRPEIPAWLFGLAGLAAILGDPLRALSLRHDLGRPSVPWLPLGAIGALALAYAASFAAGAADAWVLLVAAIAQVIGAAWIALLAWRLYQERRFRSAAMLGGAFGLLAAAMAMRAALLIVHPDDAPAAGGLDAMLVFAAGLVAALYGNLGYVGLALETARAAELARIAQLARETEARVQTERRALEQSALLAERELLLRQHRDMLAVLAHEVRQPLNNASAALQSAAVAMRERGGEPAQGAAAASRLERANSVLLQVTATLDNTLTDAVLLQDDALPTRHDVDIDTVVNLAIGDIDPRLRPRVRRQRSTGTRTASMNAGLMRLALRNLIANALAYSPEASPVTVRIVDSDEPLALLIDVVDEGPGIPAQLRSRLFERGARGNDGARLGHGLGLYIVHRVLALHEGEVQVIEGGEEPGLTMRLVIPQGLTG